MCGTAMGGLDSQSSPETIDKAEAREAKEHNHHALILRISRIRRGRVNPSTANIHVGFRMGKDEESGE